MSGWLPLAAGALAIWSIQRVVTKAALGRWSTAFFYRANATVALLVYAAFAIAVPPDPAGLLPALGLSLIMAATFWVTTEATRRGPVSIVSPLTAMSPAITVVLAVALLGERPAERAVAGVLLALVAAALLAFRPVAVSGVAGWLGLALASLVMQGVGAFIAKVVVSEHGPTDLLIVSAAVQVVVGLVIARREPLLRPALVRGAGPVALATMLAAAVATIGYLYALSIGPASVIVPLVATSPSLGGLLGLLFLRERATARQLAGIALGAGAAVLLASG